MTAAQLELSVHFLKVESQAAARQLELLAPEQACLLLQKSPVAAVVQVLRVMLPNVAAKILMLVPSANVFKWLEKLNAADVAAMLRYLDAEQRTQLVETLPRNKQALIKMLISYPEYSVGSLVETDVLILDEQMLVEDAMQRLKNKRHGYLQEIFIVNQSRQLMGKLALSQLFVLPSATLLHNVMQTQVNSIIASLDIVSAAELQYWKGTDTLAVINRKHEFVGVLHHHSLRHFLYRKDIQQNQNETVSADLVDIYGATFMSIMDLISPANTK
ncbi:magnesium transporter MgtE N-terminal domain-containing protein [Paraglaciecola hydrolytica]|uniref:Magnesium transporter MgtE intracellular domain-containing protein n=1 Tax=Paraglaciecola hydrolytica TaxID=1799789 RepID=A0A148KN56_9ALTE|nr:magnesium transporter [Paraglaciecola hydrolytica]KXI27753.1 hypothetical protein AX660_19615 [Paraglaciecola hydrolytica]